MDFRKFDNRGPAETGQRLELLDPTVKDGDPLVDGKQPCVVIVRGASARSVQAELRKRQKAKMSKAGASSDARVMEDVHIDLCGAAEPLVVGFENVKIDGRELTDSAKDIAEFLDLTFPNMGVKMDGGEPVLNKDGAPEYELINYPFAKQIIDFSAEQAKELGNAKAG